MRYLFLLFACNSAFAATNILGYGGRGDARPLLVSVTSGARTLVSGTNTWSASDVGKTVLLMSAGLAATNPYHQDLVAIITNFNSATSVTINRNCGLTTNNIQGWFGTNNAQPFWIAANSYQGQIDVPAGRYLMISTQMCDPAWVAESDFQVTVATVLGQGDVQFIGTNRDETVLMGNPCWELRGDYLQRGTIFQMAGNITNNGQLRFESMTMDGGLAQTPYRGWPATSTNGDGWDLTHGAMWQSGPTFSEFHTNVYITNCVFMRWRGEMLKSTVGLGGLPGRAVVTNCLFFEGNASAFNFTSAHTMGGNVFSNLDIAFEFYEAYALEPSYFVSNRLYNISGGNNISIQGALISISEQPYGILGNYFTNSNYGINLAPARRVTISSNTFHNITSAVLLGGAGGLGDDSIADIVISGNSHTNDSNVGQFLLNYGSSNVMVFNNTVSNTDWFLTGGGEFRDSAAWNNRGIALAGGVDGGIATYLIFDQLSNELPFKKYDAFVGGTNQVSYANGAKQFVNASEPTSYWQLVSSNAVGIPDDAVMVLSNNNASAVTYLVNSRQGTNLSSGDAFYVYWNPSRGQWGFSRISDIAGDLNISGNLILGQ